MARNLREEAAVEESHKDCMSQSVVCERYIHRIDVIEEANYEHFFTPQHAHKSLRYVVAGISRLVL